MPKFAITESSIMVKNSGLKFLENNFLLHGYVKPRVFSPIKSLNQYFTHKKGRKKLKSKIEIMLYNRTVSYFKD